ncbi:NAD(P)/FAD-dependent oxidoreductase [Niabella terrae]
MVVIGGGAAGFFCAINAALKQPHLRVVLLEKSGKLLSKVKISGGGRCNLTHACFDIPEMTHRYPRGARFLKKIFHQFFTTDTIQWFESRGVKLKTESDGRMFPVSDSSQSIINCLLDQAAGAGVQIELHRAVQQIEKTATAFKLTTAEGHQYIADAVCVACGGYPRSVLYDWLQQTGHRIIAPVPSLFTFNLPRHPITGLMGLSVQTARVRLKGGSLQQEGPVLITHWGLSGPAVLKLSAYGARELAEKQWRFEVQVNWVPEYNEHSLRELCMQWRREKGAALLHQRNPLGLPQRLWTFLLDQSGIAADCRWADLPARQQQQLVFQLTGGIFQVQGKTSFKEEFVTAGGIDLAEIDAGSMMSKKVPGLFFAGEVIDVDGITGGYNFQNAWTTGWVAAQGIARLMQEAS